VGEYGFGSYWAYINHTL